MLISAFISGPQILKCLSNSLSPEDFTGHIHRKPDPKAEEMKTDRRLYYRKLASARFGLAMPGLGYDCFR